jgi:hypothetical protein
MVKGYCVVCKEKGVEMKDPVINKTKKGGYMAKGICSKCNKTKMCAMMSKADAEKAIEAGEAKKGF